MGGSSKGAQDSAQISNTSGRGASTWAPNAAVSPLYGGILQNLQNLAYTPVPYFQGQAYVGPSQLTQQSVEAMQAASPYYQGAASMMSGASPYYQQSAESLAGSAGAMNALNQTAGGNYNFLSNAADVANNPHVQAMLKQNEQSATDWLQKQALPSLQNAGVQANALGSGRLGLAQGTAAAEAQKNLLAQNAQTQMSAYQQGLGAQQSALGMTGNMLQNQMAPGLAYGQAGSAMGQGGQALAQGGSYLGMNAQNLGAAGQTVEAYQQKALDDAMARHSYMYEEPWNRMGQVANYLTGLFGDTGTGFTSETGSGTTTGAAKTKQSGGLFK